MIEKWNEKIGQISGVALLGLSFVYMVASLAMGHSATADAPPDLTPTKASLNVWKAVNLLSSKKNVAIFDLRTPKRFALYHLPNAINLPAPSARTLLRKAKKYSDVIIITSKDKEALQILNKINRIIHPDAAKKAPAKKVAKKAPAKKVAAHHHATTTKHIAKPTSRPVKVAKKAPAKKVAEKVKKAPVKKIAQKSKYPRFFFLQGGIRSWYVTFEIPVPLFSTKPAPFNYAKSMAIVKAWLKDPKKADKKALKQAILLLAKVNYQPNLLQGKKKKASGKKRKKIAGGCG